MFGDRVRLGVSACTLTLLAALPAAADAPMEAQLLEVSGEQIKLSKGAHDGVRVGQIFDLYQDAKVYRLPLTNGDVPLVQAQQRIARVQVVKTEPSTSQALVLVRDEAADGKPATIKAGGSLRALHNPTAVAPNRRPEFLKIPTYDHTPWRESVPISLAVSNEKDDHVVYTWSSTGGRVLYDRTLRPSNRWYPPFRTGNYNVTVVAHDSAGNTTRTTLAVKSSGIEGRRSAERAPKSFKPGRVFTAASEMGRIRDVAFDLGRRGSLGRRFFLNAVGGWGSKSTVRIYDGETPTAKAVADKPDFSAVAASPDGHLYGLDTDRKVVRRYAFGADWLDLFKRDVAFGEDGGGSGNARFSQPVDLAVSLSGDLYVLDAEQRCVQVFSVQAERSLFLVSFGRPGQRALELSEPKALAIGRDDSVYVLDSKRKKVLIYKNWRPVAEFAAGGVSDQLKGLAVDPFTNDVYVLNQNSVKRFSREGKELSTFGNATQRHHPAQITAPVRLRMDLTRTLWVIDHDGDAVARFDHTGKFLGRKGGFEFGSDLKVAGGPNGGLAVLDTRAFTVTRFDPHGWVTARFGVEGTKPDQFENPVDVAISAGGDVFVLDAGKKKILRFSRQGAHVKNIGDPGSKRSELMQVRDLSTVNDRSYLAVVQQRPADNFNLLDPASGRNVTTYGEEYTGDMTPPLGCVVGVTGSLAGTGRDSADPWFWTLDDDREHVYRRKRGGKAFPVKMTFDEVTDMEVSVANQVFVVDAGESRVVVLSKSGTQVTTLKGPKFEDPRDVGIDDFGHVYIFDRNEKRIVELVPGN